MKAVIFASGKKPSKALALRECRDADLIIAADQGAKWALDCGITPHMMVGDMDSVHPAVLQKIKDANVKRKEFAARKNQTDLHLALDEACAQGAKTVVILGGMGKRMDHFLGHINLLVRLHKKNIAVCLKDAKTEIYPVSPASSSFSLSAPKGTVVSLIPLTSNVRIASLTDMAYPLADTPLPYDATLGISNIITGPHPQVTVKSGLMLVVKVRR